MKYNTSQRTGRMGALLQMIWGLFFGPIEQNKNNWNWQF